MYKYISTARMTMENTTNAGVLNLLPNYLLKVIYLIPLLALWRTLMGSGVDTGMTLRQMLTYTYVSMLLSELLVMKSTLTNWIYEGPIISLYQRPMSIVGHVIAQILGSAAPMLLFFSLPMALLSPLLGVDLLPVSLWFFPSLLLCVSLGFAIEILFACLLIRIINACWLITVIRGAIISLFSGNFIPFALLPWGLGGLLKYQPFGSLGGAPLSIYTGLAEPIGTIAIQLFWNAALWPAAMILFKKSQERMVSHGG